MAAPEGTIIDIETGMPGNPMPLVWGQDGGRPFATLATAVAKTEVNIPIVSSYSMWTVRDVVERLMAGATLAGVHTAAVYYGYSHFTKLRDELRSFLEEHGYGSVNDIIGVAASRVNNVPAEWEKWLSLHARPKEAWTTTLIIEKCNGCGICERTCSYQAMKMVNDIAELDLSLCERCGVCVSLCPTDAIKVEPI
jgi:Pyruvate/2-oxoacid:ferredoxin oxidoreductase delta subunit